MNSKVIKISGEQTWIRPVVSATKIQRHGCRGGVVGHWLEHCGGRHQQRSTAAKVPAAASVESVINFMGGGDRRKSEYTASHKNG
jgi:hypothetical protein